MIKSLKVVLVGLPGCGKSTFGRQLAQELKFPYLDLDQQIEGKNQMKIPQIFSELGEGKFRELETETLSELLDLDE